MWQVSEAFDEETCVEVQARRYENRLFSLHGTTVARHQRLAIARLNLGTSAFFFSGR
jgi:hypothetical protein